MDDSCMIFFFLITFFFFHMSLVIQNIYISAVIQTLKLARKQFHTNEFTFVFMKNCVSFIEIT